MAKAKTTTTTKTTAKTPATKKPSKPAATKKPAAKKEIPVELKLLTPGRSPVMTEKKLKKHTANGITSFLLNYKLDALLCLGVPARHVIAKDVISVAVPHGHELETFQVVPFSIGKKGTLDLRIDAKIIFPPLGQVLTQPEPTTTEGEQPSTPVADSEMPLEVPPAEPTEIPAAEPCAMAPEAEVPVPVTQPEFKFEPVIAEVVADDQVQKASFDAQEWFQQATDEDILELAREGYSHDFTSDNVAEFFREKNADVKQVFDYLDTIKNVPSKKDVNGFGCTVDEEQAITWVEANRPHLMDALAAIKDGEEAPAE